MRSATVGNLLKQAACSSAFHHKCVFYSNRQFSQTAAVREFVDFIADKNGFQHDLSDPVTKDATELMLCDMFSLQINNIHRDCLEIVFDRFAHVFEEYQHTKKLLPWLGIRVADRDKNLTRASGLYVFGLNDKLLDSIDDHLKSAKDAGVLFALSDMEWETIRQSVNVFMEEVSFLSKRVDDFNGYISSRIGTALTIVSILIAIVTFWIAQAGKDYDASKRSAALSLELGKLSEKTSSVSEAVDAQERENDVNEIVSKLDALERGLKSTNESKK